LRYSARTRHSSKDKQWYIASFEGGAESAQIFEAGGYRFVHLALSTRCRRAAPRQGFIHDRNNASL
jgi:hypothetical protein